MVVLKKKSIYRWWRETEGVEKERKRERNTKGGKRVEGGGHDKPMG